MPTVHIETYEQYPTYTLVAISDHERATDLRPFEVEQATLDRWQRIEAEYAQMHEEIDRLVRPRCPECDHPQVRHQEWSAGWDTWGCLHKVSTPEGGEFAMRTCKCQHGIPVGR